MYYTKDNCINNCWHVHVSALILRTNFANLNTISLKKPSLKNISHTFRYLSPSFHSSKFLFYLTCYCLWISININLFNFLGKINYTSISHCYSYSPHLVMISYFSFLPSHYGAIVNVNVNCAVLVSDGSIYRISRYIVSISLYRIVSYCANQYRQFRYIAISIVDDI